MFLLPGKLFPVGGPVSEKDVVDREDFIVSLETRLFDGQSIMLAGPRRTGKTSLADEVLRRMKRQGAYTATIDSFRLSDKRDFAVSLIDACLENRTGIRKTFGTLKKQVKSIAGSAKMTVKLEDLQFDFSMLRSGSNDDDLLDYALGLPEILAINEKKHMVVLFDEFQDVSRVTDTDIYKKLRSYFQRHQNVSYLFLGSKEGMMKTLFANQKEAFYRFATILPIPPIPQESWVQYIRGKFNEQKIAIDNETVIEILQKTGGHPQDTMLVCSEIYYAVLETGKKLLTPATIRSGYDRALLTLAQVYDEILDEISQRVQARQILRNLATGGKAYDKRFNPNETKRIIDDLIAKAIIEKHGRGLYNFIEPMFREHLLRQFE
ncbi:MAG TPA: ATP-binding protein [Spirochaetia bacterium]|nr:ATP-binding protein [Spirochaetia bacterium]